MSTQELRPMGIGDILDTTFRLYRQRFLAFLVIALVCYVPFALFMATLPVFMPGPAQQNFMLKSEDPASIERELAAAHSANTTVIVTMVVGGALFALIIFPLCQAAMTYNISASYLGENLSAGDSYARAAPRLIPLLWTNLLVMIAVWIGLICCVVPGIIFSLWFMIVAPIVILERVNGSKAMGRSRDLMKGNIGKGFLLMLLVGILVSILNFALSAAIGFIPWPHRSITVFIQNVLPAILLPIQTAPLILLYYDLRIRKEAFDLQRLSESLGPALAT